MTAREDDPSKSAPPSNAPSQPRQTQSPDGRERRSHERFDVSMSVTWSVDCTNDDTFLYAAITNISALGIFVRTLEPLSVGTKLTLCFLVEGKEWRLGGQVQWVNPVKALGENLNPGMGIRFVDLSIDDRERLVEWVHTIAYVRDFPQ
jgi:type IV pilus assembly protein PilZ